MSIFSKIFRRRVSYDGLQKALRQIERYRPLFKPENPSRCMDRPFIEEWVRRHAEYITGDILEFRGSSMYAEKYAHGEYHVFTTTYNKNDFGKTDFFFDIENTTEIVDKRFDCIICTQVLNYTFNPLVAIQNLKKLLKPNGHIIITVPGTWGPHSSQAPFTYNYSLYAVSKLVGSVFGDDKIVDKECFGNFVNVVNMALWVRYPDDILEMKNDDFYAMVIGVVAKN